MLATWVVAEGRFSGTDCVPFLVNTSFSIPGAEPFAEISPIRPEGGGVEGMDHRGANKRRETLVLGFAGREPLLRTDVQCEKKSRQMTGGGSSPTPESQANQSREGRQRGGC